jgi:UDP-glucose 4-epimerase
MKFFVIGGAGYIGSHFVAEALAQGHQCLVYDNLSTGHRKSVPPQVELVEASILDEKTLLETLKRHQPDAVLHYAALTLVGESVEHPDRYYENNVIGVIRLLDSIKALNPKPVLIFSSSCAVFGNPVRVPVAEDDPKAPISPYGRTKLVAEFMIEDYARAFGFKGMALRYFNACGAHQDGHIGEDHQPETHLIPNVIRAAFNKTPVTIFGNNYPTKDGTCVRDYIHVTDLAISHIEAAKYLTTPEAAPFTAIHLGTGQGESNLDVVEKIGAAMGEKVEYKISTPREGDATALFADNQRAKDTLRFNPLHSDLTNIATTALQWHRTHPNGYGD